MTNATKQPSPNEPLFANEPPFQGVICEGAISRRLSRRNTFKLFSVEVTEEDTDSLKLEEEVGGEIWNCNFNGCVKFDSTIIAEIEGTSYGGEADGMCNHTKILRSSTVSISSATAEGPMKEIFVPDQDEIEFLQEMGQRRRSSEITAESNFEQLIRQLERQSFHSQHEKRDQSNGKQVTETNSNLLQNRFRSFKGGFLSIFNSIHESLKQEIIEDAVLPRRHSDSDSSSIDAADTPEELSKLASRFHAVDVNIEAENETLDLYFAQDRLHNTSEISSKRAYMLSSNIIFDGIRTSNIAPKRHSIIADDESILQSLDSSFRQRELYGSMARAKSKLTRKCSSGLYDSTNTETTANSSVFDDSLSMGGNGSFSSIDSSSLQSIAVKGYV